MVNTKRIISNSIALYIRSIISLLLSLYTSRLIVQILGLDSFGVYMSVGGIVAIFAFIQSSMANATQRFLAFSIGTKNDERLRDVFSMCINIHFLLSVLIVSLLELVGVWYINRYLNYGNNTLFEVNLVFQTSIISMFLMINSIPYNSLLIARESMKQFAYLDILNKILQLLCVLILTFFRNSSRLLVYAILIMGINILIIILYVYICKRQFPEAKYVKTWDRCLFREMISYIGYISLPAFVSIFKTQGVVVILNTIYGPLINAAQGIANQVNSAIRNLSNNIGIAFSPQIIKSYAQKEYETMEHMFILSSEITFYLFLIIALPILVKLDFILELWLGELPSYASTITFLIILDTIISNLTSSYNTAIRATGKVKFYEMVYNAFHLLGLLMIVFYVWHGCQYYSPYIALIILSLLSIAIQIYCLKRVLPMVSNIRMYFSILRMISVFIVSFFLVFFANIYIPNSILGVCFITLIAFCLVFITTILFGLEKEDKIKLKNKLKNAINYG